MSRSKQSMWRVHLTSALVSLFIALPFNLAQCFKEPVVATQQTVKPNYTGTTMRVSAYTMRGKTATLRETRVGKDVAVSRDRAPDLLGKRVYVMCDGYDVGVREVVDLMHPSVENSLDVLVPDNKVAKDFGNRECSVIVLRD